jgi:hypothetical protein
MERILTLHIDLIFIESECYMVSVLEPLDLTMLFLHRFLLRYHEKKHEDNFYSKFLHFATKRNFQIFMKSE